MVEESILTLLTASLERRQRRLLLLLNGTTIKTYIVRASRGVVVKVVAHSHTIVGFRRSKVARWSLCTQKLVKIHSSAYIVNTYLMQHFCAAARSRTPQIRGTWVVTVHHWGGRYPVVILQNTSYNIVL